MRIKFYFVRDAKNYYSLPPLVAALEGETDVYPEIVTEGQLARLNTDTGPYDRIVFAFSLTSLAFRGQKDALARLVGRLRNRRTLFIAGGPHPSACPDDLLNAGFDTVVRGEGEAAIQTIVRSLRREMKPPAIIEEPVPDIDLYPPFPARRGGYKPIEITRGCPHGCLFCQTSYLFSRTPRHRSVASILSAVATAFSQNIKDFRFITPNALGYGSPAAGRPDVAALRSLLGGIRGIVGDGGRLFFGTFPSEVRPEYVTDESVAVLREFVDNKRLIIGAQSASNRMLRLCRRGHSAAEVDRAIDVCLRHGFATDIDIIVGMPGENPDDLEETCAFMAARASSRVRFHLHYFMPLPGTPWADKHPTPIPDERAALLEQLVGQGRAWGGWRTQKGYTSSP